MEENTHYLWYGIVVYSSRKLNFLSPANCFLKSLQVELKISMSIFRTCKFSKAKRVGVVVYNARRLIEISEGALKHCQHVAFKSSPDISVTRSETKKNEAASVRPLAGHQIL